MIVFMGTPEFSVPSLKMLIEKGYNVGLVVTQPDKIVGRKKELVPSLVKELALKHGIEVFQPVKLKEDYQYIIDLKPELIITASYGQILPKELLAEIPAINLHGSLLPKYRGGAPIQYSLFNGDDKTGITLMEMVYKMDAGDMIEKREIAIDKEDDYGSLSKKLAELGAQMLEDRIDDILTKNYSKEKQNKDEVTFAYTLNFDDEALDFSKTSAFNHNRVRGLSPNVLAHFYIQDVLVKVFKSNISDIINIQPHEILIKDKKLFIGTSDGALEILSIQQAGKKLMTVKEYLNGQQLFKTGGFIDAKTKITL